ncbi:methylenetetrahydrofolate reductase 2 [Niveomyces insectorum RCEF 264]|uniref:Methylenetetrahydrofolate reductase 2 n=1 Tax=Niveomyces insectorum RCEF 264 TaxID=1081102 RepID=A0A167PGJ7_9HYPO|nr:methylenetetrahydrofolate reductase 2 [Niveomyces insectorum RCEF 264]
MHVRDMVAEAEWNGRPSFSFEYFPPKTAQGVQNLYERMERMHLFGPKFIDITWGAGGRVAQLTAEMVTQAQTYFGLETCMHLTCTDMGVAAVDDALRRAYQAGCTNILALRGDPPRDKDTWEAVDGGFRYAKDLVAHIRQTYGDHFDIGVAGYPEGSDDNRDEDALLDHLKQKVDAGATFIVTQMFYDVDNFLRWLGRVRERGITAPVLPGIMPIATYASFVRRVQHMGCHVPPAWLAALEPVKNNDDAVREIGKTLVAGLCRRILAHGDVKHLHFYTMNLAQATRMVLDELGWLPTADRPRPPPALPWKQSLGLGRRDEDVRPIFWRNRGKSAPRSVADVAALFVRYLTGALPTLPWSDAPLTREADTIQADLVALSRRGLLTVNSQPAVDGVPSSDPVHGWGPPNGYVYQKAYLELLVPPALYGAVRDRVRAHPDLTFHAVTWTGTLETNAPTDGPNAVTWGVFPGKEIVQPTIVESISFLAWKDEAFQLGADWARCYEPGSPSRALIRKMMDEWHIVTIVNNDFHKPRTIFEVLAGLELADIDKEVEGNPEEAAAAAAAATTATGTTTTTATTSDAVGAAAKLAANSVHDVPEAPKTPDLANKPQEAAAAGAA